MFVLRNFVKITVSFLIKLQTEACLFLLYLYLQMILQFSKDSIVIKLYFAKCNKKRAKKSHFHFDPHSEKAIKSN